MRIPPNHLSIEPFGQTETLLISISERSYRSSDEEQLLLLRQEFVLIESHMESARQVIVDLSQVVIFGSGLLRVLFDQLAPLRLLGIRAILCGDRHGLVVQTALDRWVTVVADLDEAFAVVAETRVYRSPHGLCVD